MALLNNNDELNKGANLESQPIDDGLQPQIPTTDPDPLPDDGTRGSDGFNNNNDLQSWIFFDIFRYRGVAVNVYIQNTPINADGGRGSDSSTYKAIYNAKSYTGKSYTLICALLQKAIDDYLSNSGDNNGNETGTGTGNDSETGGEFGDGNGLTPDELSNWLENLSSMLNNPLGWIGQFDMLLQYFYGVITGGDKNDRYDEMSDSDKRNFINQITQQYYNFISTMYQNYYSQQMWIMQQKYNSPLEQAKRLAEAGLFNGFSSQVSSGNAESSPETSSVQPAEQYTDKGSELAIQRKQTLLSAIGTAFGALGSLGSAASSFGALYSTLSMTPLQKGVALETMNNLKSDSSLKKVQASFHSVSTLGNLSAAFKSIENNKYIAEGNWETQKAVASSNNNAMLQANQESIRGNKDVATITGEYGLKATQLNNDTQKYGARLQYQANKDNIAYERAKFKSTIVADGISKSLDYLEKMSTTKTQEHYYDAETGAEIHAETAASFGVGFDELAKASSELRFGGSFQHKGKTYYKEVLSTKEINPKYVGAVQAIVDALKDLSISEMSDEDLKHFNDNVVRLNTVFTKSVNDVSEALSETAASSLQRNLNDMFEKSKKAHEKKNMPVNIDSARPMR